jgi:hypothetical protein
VDARWTPRLVLYRQRKDLISSNFLKPSNGLEPLTPSLPSSEGQGTRGFRRVRKAKKVLHGARDVVDALAPEATP